MKKIATLIAIAGMISFGCNQTAQDEHGHDHGSNGHLHGEATHQPHEQEVFEVEEDSTENSTDNGHHSHGDENGHDHHNH